MSRHLPRKASSAFLFLCTALVAVCLVTAAAQERPYRILISNDDGVHAPALSVLAEALKSTAEVFVVAPADNQSGISQALTGGPPIARVDVTLVGGLEAIGLTATPATTMQIAIKNIVRPPPDLVVTGINAGYNLGLSAYLSGTVGAARQAVINEFLAAFPQIPLLAT